MELKFGHRVVSGAEKGRVIKPSGSGFFILLDNDNIGFRNSVELDPDATEFLTGDTVESSKNGVDWHVTTYGHKSLIGDRHYNINGDFMNYCRYPRKDPLNGKTAIIDGKEYELRLK